MLLHPRANLTTNGAGLVGLTQSPGFTCVPNRIRVISCLTFLGTLPRGRLTRVGLTIVATSAADYSNIAQFAGKCRLLRFDLAFCWFCVSLNQRLWDLCLNPFKLDLEKLTLTLPNITFGTPISLRMRGIKTNSWWCQIVSLYRVLGAYLLVWFWRSTPLKVFFKWC